MMARSTSPNADPDGDSDSDSDLDMDRVHRTTGRHFLIGVVGVAVLLLLAGLGAVVSAGGEIPGRSYSYATAAFDKAGTLKVRQDVRQNSLIVGQVQDIQYQDGQAMVTLRLDGEHPVYRNAHVRILQESALGKSFVELDPGTPNAGDLGDATIPSSQTEDSVDLDSVFDLFDPKTRTALSSTLDQLDRGLLGHTQDLQDALHEAPPGLEDLGTVATALAAPRTDVRGLVATANRLTGHLLPRSEQLRSLLRQTDTTLAALHVDGGKPLDKTLKALPPTLSTARQALDSLNGPLGDARSAVSTLRPGAEALGDSVGDLRGVLREGVPPLDKVPHVADTAKPAVSALTRAVGDLRPIVPGLGRALNDANRFVADASPYACDIGRFLYQLGSPKGLLSGHFDTGRHYFQIFLAFPPGPGIAGLPDPAYRTNPYPAPGTEFRTPRPAAVTGGGCR